MKPPLLFATFLITLFGSTLATNKKPDIVFFFVDDMGWRAIKVPSVNSDPVTPPQFPIKNPLLVEHLLTDFLITHQLIPLDIDIIYQCCKLGNFTLTQNLTLPV